MGRLPRAIDDGLVYHAFNRGNNRGDVFADDADHLAFLQAIADAKERYPFRLFGYCLMTNHFHLLLRPRARAIDQSHPPVADRNTYLAISQAPPDLGARLAGPIQEPRHPG